MLGNWGRSCPEAGRIPSMSCMKTLIKHLRVDMPSAELSDQEKNSAVFSVSD